MTDPSVDAAKGDERIRTAVPDGTNDPVYGGSPPMPEGFTDRAAWDAIHWTPSPNGSLIDQAVISWQLDNQERVRAAMKARAGGRRVTPTNALDTLREALSGGYVNADTYEPVILSTARKDALARVEAVIEAAREVTNGEWDTRLRAMRELRAALAALEEA